MCFSPGRRALFQHLNFQKWSETVFNTLDFEMPFTPQGRALFQHLNFQKWSGQSVFNTLDSGLWNVLHATRVCTFSTSQLPKVVRDSQFLTFWTLKYASRHNGVHFSTSQLPKVVRDSQFLTLTLLTSKCASCHFGGTFLDILTSKSGPRPSDFSTFDFEICFAPQRYAIFNLSFGQTVPRPPLSRTHFWPSAATNQWKNGVIRNFSAFSRACIFFLFDSSLLFSGLFFFFLLSSFFFLSSWLFLFSSLRFASLLDSFSSRLFFSSLLPSSPLLCSALLFSSLLFSSLLFSSLSLPTSSFYLSILSEVWLLIFLRWVGHGFHSKLLHSHRCMCA